MNGELVLGVALGLAAGALLGAVVVWVLAARSPNRKIQGQVENLLVAVRSGELSEADDPIPGESSTVRELRGILARDWVPRGQERDAAIRQALSRIAEYLRHRVEAPLLDGLDAGGARLQEGADAALGAVEDLEFFLEDPPAAPVMESRNLVDVVQEVTRDFGAQSPAIVKVASPSGPIPVRVDPEPFKDAIFLILHNASDFGGGAPVQVTLERRGKEAHLLIRDRGPGFSAEALFEAMNPFYSTSPGGLGLGLPHAKRTVIAQGGEIFLRNPEGGGAEVEIVLPTAS
jgi:signal transduction histidine kinase